MFLRSRDGTGVSYAAEADGDEWKEAARSADGWCICIVVVVVVVRKADRQNGAKLLFTKEKKIRLFARYRKEERREYHSPLLIVVEVDGGCCDPLSLN